MCSWKNQANFLGVHIPCPIDMFFSLKKPTWFWTDFLGLNRLSAKTCDVFDGVPFHTFEGELARFPTQFGWGWLDFHPGRGWNFLVKLHGLRLNLENRYIYISMVLDSFFCWHLMKNTKKIGRWVTVIPSVFHRFFLGGLKGQPGRRSDFLFLKWRFFDASGCHVPSGHAGRSLKYRGAAEGLFSATAPKEIRWKDMGVSKNKGTRTPKWMVGWYRAKFSLPREVRQH